MLGYNFFLPQITFSSVYLLLILIAIAVFIALMPYIFKAIAIKNYCKVFNIKNGGLGFVPIANQYKLGQIADKISEYKGKKTNLRKTLLLFSIAPLIILILFFAAAIASSIFENSYIGFKSGYGHFGELFVLLASLGLLLITFLLIVLTIVEYVFIYIALYRIYNYFAKDYSVLFIILSIAVPTLVSYMLFAISLKREPINGPDIY